MEFSGIFIYLKTGYISGIHLQKRSNFSKNLFKFQQKKFHIKNQYNFFHPQTGPGRKGPPKYAPDGLCDDLCL